MEKELPAARTPVNDVGLRCRLVGVETALQTDGEMALRRHVRLRSRSVDLHLG